MNILINDVAQKGTNFTGNSSNVITTELKKLFTGTSFSFNIPASDVNCVGLANTDATSITVQVVEGTNIYNKTFTINDNVALYYFDAKYANIDTVSVTLNSGTYLGKLAIGEYRNIKIYKSKEPEYISNVENIEAPDGSLYEQTGGITKRVINCEFKAKIREDQYSDYENLKTKIPKKMPFFIHFIDEASTFYGITYFYAKDDNPIVFQGSFNRMIYSKKYRFVECF